MASTLGPKNAEAIALIFEGQTLVDRDTPAQQRREMEVEVVTSRLGKGKSGWYLLAEGLNRLRSIDFCPAHHILAQLGVEPSDLRAQTTH